MGNGILENQQMINEVAEILRENKLLIKDGEKSKLDLTAFNRNLENASKNLGIIVPSIVEVSKEQVALINNGLEGTINFIRAFQTFNTAFAVFVEQPTLFETKYKGKINELENLETKIIAEVESNLKNLDEMLRETFKEVAGYYTALGHIIYSEEEGGTIEVKYERSNKLKNEMEKIYKRKDELKKDFSMKKSLGLVQIIDSLVDVEKEVRKIKINDTEKTEYYITGTQGEESKKIKVNIDIIEALKGISGELLNSLKGAGVLVEDQSKRINRIKQEALEQKFLAQSGIKAVKEIKEKLNNHSKITKFLKDNNSEISRLEKYKAKESDKAKVYHDIVEKEKENDQAKKAHDRIIKNQMDLIIEVVNAFGSIISLWGDQVNNEISISQIADKAVIAIDKLSKVEIKADINAEGLLVAKKTQEQIRKTCEGAKELKNVGKVMQMLLGRIKSLLSYNKGLEAQIRQFHGSKDEANNYKKNKLIEIKKYLYEHYPESSKNVSKTITEFNNKIRILAEKKNIQQNKSLVDDLIKSYEKIHEGIRSNVSVINNEVKKIQENINEFPESCKNIGQKLNNTDDKVDKILDSFAGLKKTFQDDFQAYMKLSDDYRELVKGLSPLLDLMTHLIALQKQLGQKEINLKVVNQSLKAFTMLFDEMKKFQKDEAKLDKDLYNMMKDVGLAEKDYYKEYRDRLGDLDKLLKELEEVVKNYFKDSIKKTSEAYKLANEWINSFSINFKEYNQELKGLNVGFFEKLFKTQSYKEKDFWQELKDINKSFDLMDKKINALSKLNLKEPNDVKEFCKFSTDLVNEIFSGYKGLVIEVNKVVQIMHIVNDNLSKLQGKKLESYSEMLESFKKFNNQLDELEDKTVDLEEFDRIKVDHMLKSLNDLTDFSKLEKESEKELKSLNTLKEKVITDVEDLRNYLLVFYTTYLTQVLSGKDKEKYEKILKDAKSKI
ncbi:MAG: hypothetical protein PHS81_01680 [Candidatus Nanoarchaeia archaeon]|nr:hypothetical protein [Candidatus Nanoarchaeia archaeon]